ncbi:MAG: carboxymuconolactone decarboxylase family protein [Xanthobacteraceae bacterium]
MTTADVHDTGLKLRQDIFGSAAVEQRMHALGKFGEPLQHLINTYAYGDVWQRSALSRAMKSLCVVAMTAASGRSDELRVHLKGALNNGCSAEEIQDILLLVAIYCGIPLANEAHRVAAEVLSPTATSHQGL